MIEGAVAALKMLAPLAQIAAKSFIPMGF
jgi:hypothetical protein